MGDPPLGAPERWKGHRPGGVSGGGGGRSTVGGPERWKGHRPGGCEWRRRWEIHRSGRQNGGRVTAPGETHGFDSVCRVTSLVELRVLEGPNLYFPRAAIKLTLDITGLASAPTATAERLGRRIGLAGARPGEPDTGFRQRFALRAVARLVRAIAHESGTLRLAVRGPADQRPARRRGRLPVATPRARAGDGACGGRGAGRRPG